MHSEKVAFVLINFAVQKVQISLAFRITSISPRMTSYNHRISWLGTRS